jgi:hypothetical protein
VLAGVVPLLAELGVDADTLAADSGLSPDAL